MKILVTHKKNREVDIKYQPIMIIYSEHSKKNTL